MAVNPANMEDCFPKSKCLAGPNEGVAYDRDSPCGGAANVVFNPVTCDCEATDDCVGSDECGYDIDYSIGPDDMYSLRPCGAPSCTIDCNIDEYRLCGQYTPKSGSFYLQSNRCLNKVINSTNGPCYPDKPAPTGAFTSQYWFACLPGEENPNQINCGSPVAQMPGGGYCSTAIVGPGIVEDNRVKRVKLVTTTLVTAELWSGGSNNCGGYTPPTSASDIQASVTWKAPIEDNSWSQYRFSSLSGVCEGQTNTCPGGTWSGQGFRWVTTGNSPWEDGTIVGVPCGISDGIAVEATAAVTSGQVTKGDKMLVIMGVGWSGAIGQTESFNNIKSVEVTGFSCHKPSDLV